jgi:hypothetical protein
MRLKGAFRDEAQRAEVCRALCELAELPGYWSSVVGPRPPALEFKEFGRQGRTVGQALVLGFAWQLWEQDAEPEAGPVEPEAAASLARAADVLEAALLRALGLLLVALAEGPQGLDAWLTRYRGQPLPRR